MALASKVGRIGYWIAIISYWIYDPLLSNKLRIHEIADCFADCTTGQIKILDNREQSKAISLKEWQNLRRKLRDVYRPEF